MDDSVNQNKKVLLNSIHRQLKQGDRQRAISRLRSYIKRGILGDTDHKLLGRDIADPSAFQKERDLQNAIGQSFSVPDNLIGQDLGETPEEQAMANQLATSPGPNTISGGPAINPRRSEAPAPPSNDTASPAPEQQPPKSKTRQAVDQVLDKAKDWARKRFVDPIKKKLEGQALALLLKNPYFWLVIVVIIVLAVAIAIFVHYYSLAKAGTGGTTPVRPISSVEDKKVLEKFQVLSDSTAYKSIADDVFRRAQTDILAIKEQVKARPKADAAAQTKDNNIVATIDGTSTKIDQYLSTKSSDTAQSIVADLNTIAKMMDTVIPTIPGRYPVNPDDIVTFNNDLHPGTPLNTTQVSFDNGHGTYIYPGENKCDAVDVFTKDNAKVYPAFTGTVLDVSEDGTGHKKVVIQNGDYQILYANIDASVKTGDKITDTSKPIGQTITIDDQYQVHIELTYCGICLVTTPLDQILKETKNQATWGEYLWAHIKDTLGLQ